MKEKCVIHIGMNKTGSSSIQETLYNRLTDENYAYVDLGIANHSRPMLLLFGEHPNKHNNPASKGLNKEERRLRKQEFQDALVKTFTQDKVSNFILSGESITLLSLAELTKMKIFLDQYFNHIVIVGYVRSPMSFIQSAFQQRLKGGRGVFSLDRIYQGYREKFEKFDQVFGRESVDLRKFDPQGFPDGNVVLDFCQWVGVEMKAEDTLRVNESFSKEAVSLFYTYNKFWPGSGRNQSASVENRKLINILKTLGKNKFKLSPSLMEPLLEQNRADINWMEKRLGKSLSEDIQQDVECISHEGDLLNYNPEIINEIRMLIGDELLTGKPQGTTPEEVAELIHLLKVKLTGLVKGRQTISKEKIQLTSLDIAKKIQNDNKEKLGKVNVGKIALIISAALSQIKNDIETTKNSTIVIPEFGKFNLPKQRLRKEGVAKRILFTAVKDKK